MVKFERLLGYGLIGGVALAIAYKVFVMPQTPSTVVGSAGLGRAMSGQSMVDLTTAYPHYPSAMWAETHGPININKSTQYSPPTTYRQAAPNVAFGDLVYID
jgi:hypothetical protein